MADEASIRRYWWVAGLIGVMAPGLGQLYTGRARFAAYVAGAVVMLLALFQTGIPSTFVGFAAVFIAMALVSWGSAIEAGAYAWRRSSVQRQRYHRWYIYVAYAAVFAFASEGITMGLLASIGLPSLFGVYHPYSVGSRPMEPGLLEGEYFLAERARGATKPELSDWLGSIVVVSWPHEEGTYVYRLIAAGGHTIAVSDRQVLIDGKALPQSVICSVSDAANGQVVRRSVETVAGRSYVIQNFDESARDTEEVTVADDQFFVMGDTRENSNDSRFRGPVANADFAGRALFIFWSNDWSRIGKTLTLGASVEASEYCPAAAK